MSVQQGEGEEERKGDGEYSVVDLNPRKSLIRQATDDLFRKNKVYLMFTYIYVLFTTSI